MFYCNALFVSFCYNIANILTFVIVTALMQNSTNVHGHQQLQNNTPILLSRRKSDFSG